MAENKAEKLFVEDRKVKKIETLEKKTPLGQPIFNVSFDTGSDEILTEKKFDVVKTHKKSDATSARNKLCRNLGQQIYALFMEYGLKLSEIDPTWNEVISSINAAQSQANNILWDIESEGNKTLLNINDVLMTKYGSEQKNTKKEGDAPAS